MPSSLTHAELFAGLDPTPTFVAELERLGLLHVVARDAQGRSIYGADARDTLGRVMALVDAGYSPRDIAVIANKVGLKAPRRLRGLRRAPVLLRASELADAVGTAAEQVVRWHEAGYVAAGHVTEQGEPLFGPDAASVAQALADLDDLGLPASAGRWIELSRRLAAAGSAPEDVQRLVADAAAFVQSVRAVVERQRIASRRWHKRLVAFEKQLERARRSLAPDVAPLKRPRRLRRLGSSRSRT